MRALDWSSTPVGPVETWSQSLRTAIGVLLHSRQPMFLWWGDALVQFYNDAYRPSFGVGKHPAAMGQGGADCWQEIWPIIWPQIEGVMTRGEATWHEDQLVPILRNGRLEEVYWTYGYSPVYDDGSIGGCLVVCTETTERVVPQRRLEAIQNLATAIGPATEARAVLEAAADVLAEPEVADVAFALIYARDSGPKLVRAAGLSPQMAETMDAHFRPSLAAAAAARAAVPMPEGVEVSGIPWPEPVTRVFASCIGRTTHHGCVVFGLSPRLPFDASYAEFLEQVTELIANSLERIEALRAQAIVEAERNALLLQAPVATALLTGPDHVYRLANAPYLRMIGGREVVGKAYMDAFPETLDTELPAILDEVFTTGKPYRNDEMFVPLDRDGDGDPEDHYFTFALQPLRRTSGEVYGMMIVAMDITAQVRARKTLEAAQSERETLVAELEAASRAKDEFLAMLGHELRNPLSPMVTAIELMRMQGVEEVERERAIIERQLRNVVMLVDDLLDVSRITRGVLQLERRRISVADAARRAIEQASPLIEQRRHRLEVELDETLHVDGDEARLAQVIANLLTNSAKYTERGGLIELYVEHRDGEVVVRVRDDGIGIQRGMASKLFDAFTREQRDPATGGLGLGLAIVKNLVTAHGGSVELESEGTDRGAEATVRLPLSTSSGPRTSPSQRQMRIPERSHRVWVVDDNEDAAELMAMALRHDGHDVQVAFDAPTALELATKTDAPDIALLDLGMPVVDGYELLARLRRLEGWKDVRVIAVTGYGQASDRERTEAAGFDGHLVKPVDLETLRTHLGWQ